MKKYFALLLTLVGSWASAATHEVNDYERTVYYSLTPYLEMNVMDLDSEGGILSLSLAYEGDWARQEMEKLGATYPGYKLILLTPQVTGTPLKVKIPLVGISEETILRQGQTGPYMNLQLSLKVDQVAKLKALAKKGDLLNLEIPVRASYSSSNAIENFEGSVNCADLKVDRIEDLILNLSRMKQPSVVRYEQTFVSYKKDLLQKCFEMDTSSVRSFKDVLNLPVKSRVDTPVIKGIYLEKKNHDIKFNLAPVLKVQID